MSDTAAGHSINSRKNRPPVPALRARESSEFETAATRFVSKLVKDSLDHMVAPENKLHLHHGGSWGQSDGTKSPSLLKQTSAQAGVAFEALITNDISQLGRFIATLVEGLSSEIKKDIYATVSEAADSVGNVVSVSKAGSQAQAFLDLLKTVEFGVNSRGEVTMPSLHASPDVARTMLDDLNAQGPEFRSEVDRVKQEKARAALQREQERLDRYAR